MSHRPRRTSTLSRAGAPWYILDLPDGRAPIDKSSHYTYAWLSRRYRYADYPDLEEPRDSETVATLWHRIEEPHSTKPVLRGTLYHISRYRMRNVAKYNAQVRALADDDAAWTHPGYPLKEVPSPWDLADNIAAMVAHLRPVSEARTVVQHAYQLYRETESARRWPLMRYTESQVSRPDTRAPPT